MAGSSVIGALRVVLGADTAALEKGLKDARGQLSDFGKTAGVALAAAATAMAAGLTGLTVAVRGQLKEFDDLSKTSQKIGVPVEQLTALRYAAELSDVSAESLTKGLGKLARSAVDAAQGSTTAVAAYQALGVSFRDAGGNIRSVGDLLPDISDKFAGMKDGSVKTALAMQIFGKAGADLIPLLNGGSSGLKEMTDEATAFGLVIDGKTAAAAEAFNDNLTRLGRVFTGLVTQITAEMLPALLQFSKVLVDFAKNGELVKSVADTMVSGFRFVVEETLKAAVTFQRAAADFMAFANVIDKFFGTDFGALKKAWADFGAERDKSQAAFSSLGDTIKKFNTDAATGFDGVQKSMKSGFEPTIIKTTRDALESFIASQIKHIAATEAQAATFGKSASEQEKMKIVAEASAIAMQNNIPITEAMRLRIEELGNSAAAAAMKLQGAQLTQQVMTPAEQYEQQLQLQTQLFESGAISADTYALAQRKASIDAGTAWDVAGASIAGSFKQISGSFAKESGAMATVAKVAGAIQATISMFTGAAKALELPFPANLAAMASVLATGAGLVASINSTAVPKFATGGMMKVGGSGGIDSQRLAMDVSPGEVVQVHQNQYGSSPSNGGFRVIEIAGLNLRPVWSMDNVRDLIENINLAVGDGARLKIVPA